MQFLTPGAGSAQTRVAAGLQALYMFDAGSGTVVNDVSGVGTPLNLTISNPGAVTWLPGGLRVNSSTTIISSTAAQKIISAATSSNEITLEAWISPANTTQMGPARMVSISGDPTNRNITLAQGLWGSQPSALYTGRVRTTTTNTNGEPDLITPNGSLTTALTHVVYTRNAAGVVTLYINGVVQASGSRTGTLGNWNTGYRLVLANEATGDRPWLGEYYLVAVFGRALTQSEVSQNYLAGPNPGTNVLPTASFTATPTSGAMPLIVNFDASASTDPDGSIISYSWNFGDGNNGSGVTTSHQYTTSGSFTVTLTVTDNEGGTGTASTTITVIGPPGITTHPANQTVAEGQTATFTVVATGTGPLSYQWQKNMVDIGGATTSSYTTPPTSAGDNSSTYRCIVSNAAGNATSNEATLTVLQAPLVTTNPVNKTVNVGQTATFSVAATGSAPLAYQWQKNGTNIAGATSSAYTTPAATAADNGAIYRCIVSNAVGADTSNGATLTVNAPPTVTTHPTNQTVSVGQTATFAVVASGTAPLSYQWQKNTVDIGGATSSSYTTPPATLADNGSTYRCVVTNAFGDATSNGAQLTVLAMTPRVSDGLLVLYTFNEGSGSTVNDVSGVGTPLNLTIANAGAVSWLTGGLSVNSSTLISSPGAATKVISAAQASNAITVEAWVKPANTTQKGPARFVTISADPNNRNVTLGQGLWGDMPGNLFNTRLRTTTTNANGQPELSTAAGTLTTQLTHVVYTRDAAGNAKIYINGSESASTSVTGNFSTWNTAYRLGLANELTADRPWLGEFYLVAMYGKALSQTEVLQNFNAGALAGSNQPPVANFTADPTSGAAPLMVNFNASASLDPDGSIISYSWNFGDGTNGSGVNTSHQYTTSGSFTATLTVTDNEGGTGTASTTITVIGPPGITTHPANQTVAEGQTATFTIVASGTPPLLYQWQKNGADIGGANNSSYTTPPATAGDNGSTYRCIVSNSAGNVTSDEATLTVLQPPVVTTDPVNQTVTVGETATFSVVATGSAPLSYQWQKNDTNIAGATNDAYTTPATTPADNGALYRCIVSNVVGADTSADATLAVIGPPGITTHPGNQTVAEGQTATFTVVASGTPPLSYQWQKDGSDIIGAESSSYTTPPTTAGDNGSTYRCIVSNSAGNATSDEATLTVLQPPVVTTDPVNQTVTVDETATFSVVATGSAPLSYQWQKNGANIAGAVSSAYTTPATTAADNGAIYRCIVSNAVGADTSNGATLTVNSPPVITTHPVNQTVSVGQTATFSVVAAGTAPLAYRWQKNGLDIGGATGSSYTTPPATVADNGSTYRCVVTNAHGGVTSNEAQLTVLSTPTRVGDGLLVLYTFGEGGGSTVNDVSGVGTPLNLTIANAGAVSWLTGGLSVNSSTLISSPGAATKVISAAQASNAITVEAWVKPANTTQKGPARFVTISADPNNRNVTLGQGLWGDMPGNLFNTRLRTTTTNANGQPELSTAAGTLTTQLTHVVYTRDAAGNAKIYINGSESASTSVTGNFSTWNTGYRLGLANELTADRPWLGEFYLVAMYGKALSQTEVLQNFNAGALAGSNQPPVASFTADPTSGPLPLTVNFNASASVDPDGSIISYSWNFGDGTNGSGVNTSHQYTTSGSFTATLTVTDNEGGTGTASTTITVIGPPGITTHPANQTVAEGQTATFTIVASGTPPLSYQWQKNGSDIGGANNSSYTTPPTTAGENGSTYRCIVTNAAGNATSNEATLTVLQPPVVTTDPVNQTVTVGQTASFSVAATGSAPLAHQWQKNGSNIAGASSDTYTTPPTTAADNGAIYRCIVSNIVGADTSADATLTVNTPPVVTTHPTNQSVTVGQTATFTVIAIGTAPLSYQWQKNNVDIGGATGSSYTTPPVAASDSGSTYRCVVTNPFGTAESNAAVLHVTSSSGRVTEGLTVLYTFEEGAGNTVNDVSGAGVPLNLTITSTAAVSWSDAGLSVNSSTTIISPGAATKVTAAAQTSNEITIEAWLTPANTTQNGPARIVSISGDHLNRNATLGQGLWGNQATAVVDVRLRSTGSNLNGQPDLFTPDGSISTSITHVVYTRTAAGVARIYVNTMEQASMTLAGTLANWDPSYRMILANEITGDRPWLGVLHLVAIYDRALTPQDVMENFQAGPGGITGPLPPIITRQPANQTALVGQTATFDIDVVAQPPITYQWQKNRVDIAGATGSSYTTPPTDLFDHGSKFRCIATSAGGTATSSEATLSVADTATMPKIRVWYGPNQRFGQIGHPVPDINILGNVSGPNPITSLSYRLNGGAVRALSMGPDTRRLLRKGDFNIDISRGSLLNGNNTVIITAVDNQIVTVRDTVTVNYTAGTVWPIPYSINWSSAGSIENVAQVVDGIWEIQDAGVRPLQLGYDRLIAIGQGTWTNYEVTVPITIHRIDTAGYAPPSSGPGIGVLLRWPGHTDNPVSGWQPKTGYLPLGAIGWYNYDFGGERLMILGNNLFIYAQDWTRRLFLGTRYIFKMRVQSNAGAGPTYRLKVWPDGLPEPATWDLTGQAGISDPVQGSLLLIAHHVDATFGNVTVTTPIAKQPDEPVATIIPSEYVLHQNYPNPFNPETHIRYGLPEDGHVTLTIYDLLGREVVRLVDGHLAAGEYGATWHTDGVASGVYFYRITVGRFSDMRRMVVIK